MRNDEFRDLIYSDEEIDNEFLDAAIKLGCHEDIKNSQTTISEEAKKEIAFSDEFKKRMDNMFKNFDDEDKFEKRRKNAKKVKNFALKVCACLGIFFIASLFVITTSEAARVKFLNMYIDVTDSYAHITFLEDGEENVEDYGEHPIMARIKYIPEEYEVQSISAKEFKFNANFENPDGSYFIIADVTGGDLKVDTEDAKIIEKAIGNYDCFISMKKGMVVAVARNEEEAFLVSGDIPLEEVEKIIENIN